MNAEELNRTLDLPELVGQSTRLRRRGAYHVGPCPFCGGRDRFVLKHGPRGWRWLCRGCGGCRYQTPIDYVMRRDGLGFKEALQRLAGEIANPAARHAKIRPLRVATKGPTEQWQTCTAKEVDRAASALLSPSCEPARRYLLDRGLHRGAE